MLGIIILNGMFLTCFPLVLYPSFFTPIIVRPANTLSPMFTFGFITGGR